MACELCTDPSGIVLVPYYGLAPHEHGFSDGRIVFGATKFSHHDQFPSNFKQDPESPNHGTWWCEHCGEGNAGGCCVNLLINQVWFGDGNNHSFADEWGATVTSDCYDEDWKTESARPKGLVSKGTKVTMLKSFQNFDGIFVKCRRDGDGVVFDLAPKNLIPCGESK